MKAAQTPRSFIPYGKHYLDEDDILAVTETLRRGPITQGPKIQEFEESLAAYVGARYAVAVSNGTAGLHLACLAAGLSPGQTLITSPNTFAASANCALYVQATPAFSDIHHHTLNLDPAHLAITLGKIKNCKVVVPVHFGGFPCEMPAIKAIADRHHAIVIEDAAHALGAIYPEGGKVGNGRYAAMTVFSFHPVKIIAAGEGGAITTNDESLYHKLLQLRTHGITKDATQFQNSAAAHTHGKVNPWYYEMQELGFNYRMTDFQAALGQSQLRKVETFLRRRKEIAARYDKAFQSFSGITLSQTAGRANSAHHLYIVRLNFSALGISRADLMEKLQQKFIGTQVHYLPVYQHPYYQKTGNGHWQCPEGEDYYKEALSLPMYYGLSDDDQDYVIHEMKGLLS